MRRDGTENGWTRGRREGGKKKERDEESTRRGLRGEAGDAENVEGKKRKDERAGEGGEREESEEETAVHTLPSRREATGRTETAGNSGRETEGKKRGKNAFVDCSIE